MVVLFYDVLAYGNYWSPEFIGENHRLLEHWPRTREVYHRLPALC